MRVVVEFHRTQDIDDAHAIVGRETAEAADLDDAKEAARRLSLTLNMVQRPDAMTITDANGATLYSGAIDAMTDIEASLKFLSSSRPAR